MIRRPPRSTPLYSSAASDVYKRQFYNHNLYWEVIAPGGAPNPEGVLLDAVKDSFGSVENFRETFVKAAVTRFGSGWAWLVLQEKGLVISSTPNQDNPPVSYTHLRA